MSAQSQWLDWNGIRHIVYYRRQHTVCWISTTRNIDLDAERPPTCLACVAWEERSGQRAWDLEKQGRSDP